MLDHPHIHEASRAPDRGLNGRGRRDLAVCLALGPRFLGRGQRAGATVGGDGGLALVVVPAVLGVNREMTKLEDMGKERGNYSVVLPLV